MKECMYGCVRGDGRAEQKPVPTMMSKKSALYTDGSAGYRSIAVMSKYGAREPFDRGL